jgi:prepilin signal peptidase PulO-like enzyme (type II secretory pathway)
MDILFWFIISSMAAMGIIIGSFLNCLIWRSYAGESALKGRSYCPKCRHKLAWADLVPVASFLFLGARCRYCKKPISWQYPAVELATGALFVAAALEFAPEVFLGGLSIISFIELLAYWVVLSALVVIFVADLRWYFIPDGALVSGIAAMALLRGVQFIQSGYVFGHYDFQILLNPLLSLFGAAAFFLAIFLLSRGKWIGFGDVKYALLMGLALGFPDVLIALFLANFFGAIIGLALIAAGKKNMKSEIPFGPFLVGGTLIALFFSDSIIGWYLSINY